MGRPPRRPPPGSRGGLGGGGGGGFPGGVWGRFGRRGPRGGAGRGRGGGGGGGWVVVEVTLPSAGERRPRRCWRGWRRRGRARGRPPGGRRRGQRRRPGRCGGRRRRPGGRSRRPAGASAARVEPMPGEILLLVEAIGAGVAARVAVGAAVVGEHVEPARREVGRDRDRGAAVVRQAVQVDDGALAGQLGAEPPALELDADVEFHVLELLFGEVRDAVPGWVQERIRAPGCRHARDQEPGDAAEAHAGDPASGRAGGPGQCDATRPAASSRACAHCRRVRSAW